MIEYIDVSLLIFFCLASGRQIDTPITKTRTDFIKRKVLCSDFLEIIFAIGDEDLPDVQLYIIYIRVYFLCI